MDSLHLIAGILSGRKSPKRMYVLFSEDSKNVGKKESACPWFLRFANESCSTVKLPKSSQTIEASHIRSFVLPILPPEAPRQLWLYTVAALQPSRLNFLCFCPVSPDDVVSPPSLKHCNWAWLGAVESAVVSGGIASGQAFCRTLSHSWQLLRYKSLHSRVLYNIITAFISRPLSDIGSLLDSARQWWPLLGGKLKPEDKFETS